MNRKLSFIFTLVMGGMGALSAPVQSADRYPWMTDLNQARSVASALGKPLLLVFRCEP